ncbi:MAG TPA: CRISPR-associated endoribonuclease Cas6, partial [Firmicutes bacterium]|nr:CRISPR-associated endoribonuclease Cas6 [Bacillota bacterium]
MQIKLTLQNVHEGPVRLPRANLHILQAFVYHLFSERLADFLHNEGFRYGNRVFKLFTFSWLSGSGPVRRVDEHILLFPPLTLSLSSPLLYIVQDAVTGALTSDTYRLGNNFLCCQEVEVIDQQVSSENVVVKTLSPITCYTTLYKQDGSPYTVFHEPEEAEFQRQIDDNLRKKYRICWPDRPLPESQVRLEPIDTPRRQIALYSKESTMPTKGWWGTFRATGPRELLQMGLDAGFGSKNSGGWGCVQLIG